MPIPQAPVFPRSRFDGGTVIVHPNAERKLEIDGGTCVPAWEAGNTALDIALGRLSAADEVLAIPASTSGQDCTFY